jgi:hypothetical protein
VAWLDGSTNEVHVKAREANSNIWFDATPQPTPKGRVGTDVDLRWDEAALWIAYANKPGTYYDRIYVDKTCSISGQTAHWSGPVAVNDGMKYELHGMVGAGAFPLLFVTMSPTGVPGAFFHALEP